MLLCYRDGQTANGLSIGLKDSIHVSCCGSPIVRQHEGGTAIDGDLDGFSLGIGPLAQLVQCALQ